MSIRGPGSLPTRSNERPQKLPGIRRIPQNEANQINGQLEALF